MYIHRMWLRDRCGALFITLFNAFENRICELVVTPHLHGFDHEDRLSVWIQCDQLECLKLLILACFLFLSIQFFVPNAL